MRKRLFLIPFISLFALSSCDLLDSFFDEKTPTEEKDEKKEDTTVSVTGINLIKTKISLEEGQHETIEYAVLPTNATNKSVTWMSNDESVAVVSNGVVYAVSTGETELTVTTIDGGFTNSCIVAVTKAEPTIVNVESVSLNEHTVEIEMGNSFTIGYEVLPENATDKSVNWRSLNEDIAVVNDGIVYGNYPGTTQIEITTNDGNYKDYCSITVTGTINVTGVNIIKDSAKVEVGSDELLQYSVYPVNATNKDVTWDSSNKAVATVENGVLHAFSKGTTVVTVKTVDGNKTDTCDVEVIDSTPVEDDPDKNGEFYGGLVEGSKYKGYEFSKSKEEIVKPSSGYGDINVYAFNDFHGAIIKQTTSSGNETGLKQLATFYKEKSQEDNTLIFDQGDTWQGSFESNYTYGSLIQDVFTYAGVSARTVGNHDFDWGLEHLQGNSERTYNDDYIPCLAANVFDYNNGVNGDIQQSQLGKEYCTYVLDNGIKVGVIGVIGETQITSICSQNVSSICFTDYVSKIKELSNFLRTNKDCDVIIASTHHGSSDATGSGLTEVSSVTGKRYVDLVLGGHDHYKQEYTVDGVRFVQWAANGINTGKVTLKYDFSSNQLVDEETTVDSYNANYFDNNYPVCEPTIAKMVDEYLEDIEPIADEVLSTNFVGSFDTGALARVMAEAIYDRVNKTIPDLQFAVCNFARTSFSGSTLTYRDLYKCFPFDNQIILLDVSSNYGINNITYNYTYRGDTELNPDYGSSYKCAILDYVALHQNEKRKFDKFPDAEDGYSVFNDTLGSAPTYREILYSYLKANPTKTFNINDYSSSNEHFL